jgi:hypothetical protein
LILASTKDFSHRIPIGRGIFAEITLIYKNKTYEPLEWTYPDYTTIPYHNFFKQVREAYVKQIGALRSKYQGSLPDAKIHPYAFIP